MSAHHGDDVSKIDSRVDSKDDPDKYGADPDRPMTDEETARAAVMVQRMMRMKWAKQALGKKRDKEPRVSVKAFYKYVSKEIEDEVNCKALLFTLIVVISFICFADGFLRSRLSFAIGDAIINDIEENANFAFVGPMGNKVFRDVHTVADFWSWVRLGALPLMIQPEWQYGEQYPYPPDGSGADREFGTFDDAPAAAWQLPIRPQESDTFAEYRAPYGGNQYLLFNRVIGGVRMAQERAMVVGCKGPAGDWLGKKPCFNGRYKSYDIPPDHKFLPIRPTERVEWLLNNKPYEILHDTLTDMEDGCQLLGDGIGMKNRSCYCSSCHLAPWVDDATMAVDLAIFIFNPTYGVYTKVSVYFIFSRGGRIWKRIDVQSASSSNAYDNYAYVSAAMWGACFLYILFAELHQVFVTLRKGGLEGFYREYLTIHELIDWLTIGNGVMIISTLVMLLQSVSVVDETAADYLEDAENPEALEEITDVLEHAFVLSERFRVLLGCYAVIIIMRLFKGYDSNPRLAQVTRTIGACMVDLLHFGVVFFSILYMYAVAGTIFFGHRMAEFVTIDRAIRTCYIILLGELDWEEMVKSAGRVIATSWFMTFTTVIVFVMFNMLLAIIFGTYDEVRANIGPGAETLWSQTIEITSRMSERIYKKDVSMSFVKQAMLRYGTTQRKTAGTVYAVSYNKHPKWTDEDLLLHDPQDCQSLKLNQWMPEMPVRQGRKLVLEVLAELEEGKTEETKKEEEYVQAVTDVLSSVQEIQKANKFLLRRLERIEGRLEMLEEPAKYEHRKSFERKSSKSSMVPDVFGMMAGVAPPPAMPNAPPLPPEPATASELVSP
jgi:hypothetical protein